MTSIFDAKFSNIWRATTIGGNVLVGAGALSAINTNATFNTCVGCRAGNTITANDYNTIIGYDADVAVGTSKATVIGATSEQRCASTTTTSVALGYGATSTFTGVCTIGNPADAIRVVQYGPRLGIHYNETVAEGFGTYTGGSVSVSVGVQIFDGLTSMYNTGSVSGTTARTITLPSASSVVSSIPNWRVGSAFYFKVGVYKSRTVSYNVRLILGSGWTAFGGLYITNGYVDGAKNMLCVITGSSSISMYTSS